MGVPNLTRTDAQARAALLDVTAYEVELDLTDGRGKPGERTFRSRTTVRFRAARAGAATFIDLVAERIRGAVLNGAPLDVAGYAPETGLELGGPGPGQNLLEENTLVVDADCIYSNTGEGLHRFVDPVDSAVYLYSQFETADAKRMYACFDQPDLKAPFTLTVTAPADWQLVSNGRPAAHSAGPGGAQVVRFTTTPPLPTYVTALCAGPYHRLTDRQAGIDLGVYNRASTSSTRRSTTAIRSTSSISSSSRSSTPARWRTPGASPSRRTTSSARRSPRPRTSVAPRPCSTSWRTCGSATWSPCAGGTTCGSTSRSRRSSQLSARYRPPAGPRRGPHLPTSRRRGPIGRTSCHRRIPSRPTFQMS